MKTITQKAVSESLQNAIENGYDLLSWSDDEIAQDLGTYDDQFGGADPGMLIPFIRTFREQHVSPQVNLMTTGIQIEDEVAALLKRNHRFWRDNPSYRKGRDKGKAGAKLSATRDYSPQYLMGYTLGLLERVYGARLVP